MTKGQLRDHIKFEAGLQDSDVFDVWLDEVIQSTLNSLTAITRFQELKVVDHVVTLTAATQLVTIPEAQHIDMDEIFYLPEGDREAAYLLEPRKEYRVVNEGRSTTIIRKGKTQFSVFPYGEVLGTDQILYTYWAYPLLPLDSTVIPVEELVTTLRHEVVSQAVLHADSKQFAAHRTLARTSHSRMFGAIDVNE